MNLTECKRRLRHCREALGLTCEQVGRAIGIKGTSYVQYERRYGVALSLSRLYDLAELYGVSLDYLTGRVDGELDEQALAERFYGMNERVYKQHLCLLDKKGRARLDVSCAPDTSLRTVWPYNLLSEVFEEKDAVWKPVNGDQDAGIAYALSLLSDRQQEVIFYHLRRNETFDAVGKRLGLTRQRVQQLHKKAIKALRHPNRLIYIRFGREGGELEKKKDHLETLRLQLAHNEAVVSDMQAKTEEIRSEAESRLRAMHIEDVFLSRRAYNCLVRNGIRTLAELESAMQSEAILQMRNAGVKTVGEFVDIIKDFGGIDYGYLIQKKQPIYKSRRG